MSKQERAYKLYVQVDASGAIVRSMMVEADVPVAAAGMTELLVGPWWGEIASAGGERWYYRDGPRRRQPIRIALDRRVARADGADEILVSLDGQDEGPVPVSLGGEVVRLTPGQDRVRLSWGRAARVAIKVLDPRYLDAEEVVEFTEPEEEVPRG